MKTSMKTSMKTTMKFFAALAIMMGFTMGAMAQTATIAGKANVISQVTIEKASNLNFGNVTPGSPKSIGFDAAVTLDPTLESKGRFTITKNTLVTLKFTLPTVLDGTDLQTTGKTLPIGTYITQLTDGTNTYGIDITDGFEVPVLNADQTQIFYGESTFSVDLGGTVTPAPDQTAGAYSSDITLTATFN